VASTAAPALARTASASMRDCEGGGERRGGGQDRRTREAARGATIDRDHTAERRRENDTKKTTP
jgi:hypothetical protein